MREEGREKGSEVRLRMYYVIASVGTSAFLETRFEIPLVDMPSSRH